MNKRFWTIITTIPLVLILTVAALFAGARIAGIGIYTVLSGSMEPTYHVGSVIFVRPTKAEELKLGDAITFMISSDTVVTHRIVEITGEGEQNSALMFKTKGDANNHADAGLVHQNNVLGKAIFSVPYMGYVVNYIQHPPGLYVAIAVAAFLLLLTIVPSLLSSDKQ